MGKCSISIYLAICTHRNKKEDETNKKARHNDNIIIERWMCHCYARITRLGSATPLSPWLTFHILMLHANYTLAANIFIENERTAMVTRGSKM